jgi:N-acetylmuramoyl-L-alanine amidase-like protein
MTSGLLIDGKLVPVPGVTVIPPASHGGPAWCALAPGDYRARKTTWCRQTILHTTKGASRQYTKPGVGPPWRERNVAEFWRDDPAYSCAHIVIGSDGVVACLADLARVCAYHATVSNDYSVGIELYQEADTGVYEATFAAAIPVVRIICATLGIPYQYIADRYNGHPLPRMLNGGSDVVGVTGHRSNSENRGWGDPGDEVFARLAADGCEPVTINDRQDIALGMQRQRYLNTVSAKRGETLRPLVVDGLVGPSSLAAMRRLMGPAARWRDVGMAERAA